MSMNKNTDHFLEDDTDLLFEPEPEEAHSVIQEQHDQRMKIVLRVLKHIYSALGEVIALLDSEKDSRDIPLQALQTSQEKLTSVSRGQIIEGVFNGEAMVGSDGQIYIVTPNYASKSRLVEGDLLKLTILPNGDFVFKQIGPMERERKVGVLAFDGACQMHVVLCDDEVYCVLPACVTYHKAELGDEVIILVPKETPSRWAAVENVIKKEYV